MRIKTLSRDLNWERDTKVEKTVDNSAVICKTEIYVILSKLYKQIHSILESHGLRVRVNYFTFIAKYLVAAIYQALIFLSVT